MTDVKPVVNTYWNQAAAAYDTSPGHDVQDPERQRLWSVLLDAAVRGAADPTVATGLTGGEPLDVLDVGCGTGFLSLRLAAAGHRVTGVDQSPEMLDRARAKAAAAGVAVSFLGGDADTLPVPAGSQDAVVERHVLWTMADPVATLRAWGGALRPGGRLVLVEGDWRDGLSDEKLADDDPEFLQQYRAVRDRLPLFGGRPAEQVRALVEAAGFTGATARPLDETRLWEGLAARTPSPRYLVTGARPA